MPPGGAGDRLMLKTGKRPAIIGSAVLALTIGCSSSTRGLAWGGEWSVSSAPKVTTAAKVTLLRSCAGLQRHASFLLDADGIGVLLAHQPMSEKDFAVLRDCLLSSPEITRVSDAL
jgi:hypothetical protein